MGRAVADSGSAGVGNNCANSNGGNEAYIEDGEEEEEEEELEYSEATLLGEAGE
jgi:hypothetical protein